jgi:hypothetical protein
MGVVTMESTEEELGGGIHKLTSLPNAYVAGRVAMRELLKVGGEPEAAEFQLRRAYGHVKVMGRVKQPAKAETLGEEQAAAAVEADEVEGGGVPCEVSVFAELGGECRLRVQVQVEGDSTQSFVTHVPAAAVEGMGGADMFQMLSLSDAALAPIVKKLQLPPSAAGLAPPPSLKADPSAVALARGKAMAEPYSSAAANGDHTAFVMQWALYAGDGTPFVPYRKADHYGEGGERRGGERRGGERSGGERSGLSPKGAKGGRSFVGMVKDTIESSLFEAAALRERLAGNCVVGMEVVRGPSWEQLAESRGFVGHRADWESRLEEDGGAGTVGTVLAYTTCAPSGGGSDDTVALTKGDAESLREEVTKAITALEYYQQVKRVNLARDQEEEEAEMRSRQARRDFVKHFGKCYALVRWGEDEGGNLGIYCIGHKGRFHLSAAPSSEPFQSILEKLKLTDASALAAVEDVGSAMMQRQRQLSKMLLPVAGAGCYGMPRKMDPKLLAINSTDPYSLGSSAPLSPSARHRGTIPGSASSHIVYRGLPLGWEVDKRPGNKRGGVGADESERYYMHNGMATSPSKALPSRKHAKKRNRGRTEDCELGCCVGAAVERGLGEVPASLVMYYPHGCELTKGYLLGMLVKCAPELVQSTSSGWNYNRLRKIVQAMVDSTVLVRVVSSDGCKGDDLLDEKLVGKEGFLVKYSQWKKLIPGKAYEIRLRSTAAPDPLAAAAGGDDEHHDDGEGKRMFVLGKHLQLLRAGAGAGAGAMGAGAAGCAVSAPIGTGLFSLAKAELFADLLRANGIEAVAASQFAQGREAEQGRMAAAARASLRLIVGVCNRALKSHPPSEKDQASSKLQGASGSEGWRREGVSSRRWQLWRTILLDALRSSKAQKGAGHRGAAIVEAALVQVRLQLLQHEDAEHQRAMVEMQERQQRKEAQAEGGSGGAARGGRHRMKKTIESLRKEERVLRMWEEGVMQQCGGSGCGGSCECAGSCGQAGVTQSVSVCGSGRCGYQQDQRKKMAKRRGACMVRAHEAMEMKMEKQIRQDERARRERKRKCEEETAKTQQMRLKAGVEEERKRAEEKEKEEKRRRQWEKLAGGDGDDVVSYPDRWFDRFGDKRTRRTRFVNHGGRTAWGSDGCGGDDNHSYAPHAHQRGVHGFAEGGGHSHGQHGHAGQGQKAERADGVAFEWGGDAAFDVGTGGMLGGMDDMLRMLD